MEHVEDASRPVRHAGRVIVLDPASRVLLMLNESHAYGVHWGTPGGGLEPGEDYHAAAVRELAEETGYEAKSWRKVFVFYPSPGILSEQTHLFVASELTAGTMRPEADEQLEPHVVPFTQALAWTRDGTIRDAKTLLALFWFQQQRQSPGS